MSNIVSIVFVVGCFVLLSDACFSSGGSSSSGSGSTSSSKGAAIARTADSHVGSTKWSYASSHRTGRNTNKCNIFVAEVIEQAGATVPHRHFYSWSPIGAGEWGNPSSSYLTGSSCWSRVTSPRNGDVAGDGVHVAIVTGSSKTTSATSSAVVKNDWGFDPPSRVANVFWRYTC
ncbi:hypothetical protein CAPTEDRAFT_186074 [Capitella teleta]|uniref:Peptidase C51 domain-containing protein n=1 Tax=Capitella teleta TaxID=283909 RepID=R7TFD2_CAPTE|nr:hypothetical protein CAPTEDRAFT_186074 [Capitella teleta]|eukprot:ELT92483.1 hypothetical protein CAPTEDRAFT_186074 [Capitella teleta]